MPQIKIFVDGAIPEQPRTVANVFGKTLEECEERAKLITAAPELLKALQYIASWSSYEGHPIHKAAKEAIKKATE